MMRYGASVLPCRIPACTCISKKSVLPSFVMTCSSVKVYSCNSIYDGGWDSIGAKDLERFLSIDGVEWFVQVNKC